ncbi:unnamed protein product [Polarella glacialis]|uniref:Protein-serine/threonine kinase n=1 Tax=Polarella glacialis TaxID=89957 RepID=A0A813DLM7_POLGL|nr:unnamed protein product [Polarella glacialis]CAE8653070.1 unnamed protein product [Polarella glacialis]CAE8700886.1 unnamed protein product [Polarella glacialis]
MRLSAFPSGPGAAALWPRGRLRAVFERSKALPSSPVFFGVPTRRVQADASSRAFAHVPVSHARLEQLLEAEITTLSLRVPKPLTVKCLLEVTEGSSVEELAQLLHEELPVRFAQRIKMLEDLPDWKSKVSIASVRQMYVTSFKELRLADPHQPQQFQKQLRAIKERHAQTNLLVGSFNQYAEACEIQTTQINEWLDKFFALRLYTNMLMSHYLQISRSSLSTLDSLRGTMFKFEPQDDPYRSSIDPNCQVHAIAQHAADVVTQMSRLRYGLAPDIEVVDRGSQPLPFVPRYLLYIISELLKNAVRSTVELHAGKDFMPPIRITVSGDENVCCCRISDEGGGIPRDKLSQVWSYLYSTAPAIKEPSSRKAVDAPADLKRVFGSPQFKEAGAEPEAISVSPLAGLGCGLPLSRLYARHLGGSVELQTMPRCGTDVYVYINRLGTGDSLPYL